MSKTKHTAKTRFLERLNAAAVYFLAEVSRWSDLLAEDPAKALGSGNPPLDAGASISVLSQSIGFLESGGGLESLKEMALDHVLYAAKYPQTDSGSDESRATQALEAKMWAKIYEWIA